MLRKILVSVFLVAITFSGVALAADFVFPWTTTVGVLPEYKDPWKTGDAAQECVTNLGYDFGLKIDSWNQEVGGAYTCDNGAESCFFAPGYENAITISNNDGVFFDWASAPFALSAVVVKGGQNANVFSYNPAVNMDTGLYAPINPNNGKPFDISHASFCWNKQELDQCYQDETAWAVGNRYVKKGNWAMYVPYAGAEQTVDLRAGGGDGVGMKAGTATFSAPVDGYVTITIKLENTFIFYYDLNNDQEDHTLKVQDYAQAPNKNPSPGQFAWKAMLPVGSTTAEIKVPANNFYGVHLDLAYQVPCQ